jgi:MFS family permease
MAYEQKQNPDLNIATNISILTTTQSSIAADLDAFETASWFTSSYLIAMSSLAPLMGRLCQVFSPRLCMFFSTMLISIGSVITSTSMSFEHFIIGRVVTGAGGGGIFIVASIMAIQMTSPERRGLYMGLANTAMTVGVSLGAVIAGALEPRIGWVGAWSCQPFSLLADVSSETALRYSGPTKLGCWLLPIVLDTGKPYFKEHQVCQSLHT